MCGIVGMIAKTSTGFYGTDSDIFQQMLWADQLRGTHGTGVFYNNKKKEVYTYKDSVNASTLINYKDWDKVTDKVVKESSFIIGHNRHATKGAHTVENTHPFIEGQVVLVHNGTLTSHKHLADCEVDSQAIAKAISTSDNLQTVVDDLYGAYALIWHDGRNGKINILRNSERPLAWVETSKCIFIASELEMARWIVTRNKETIIGEGRFETHFLYQVTPGTGCISKTPMIPSAKPNEKWNSWNIPSSTNKNTGNVTTIPYKKSYFKGDKLEFIPTDIITEGNIHYLSGVTEGDNYQDDMDVRWYCKDMNTLDDLVYITKLTGTVQSLVYRKEGSYYLLSHVTVAAKALS